MLELTVYFENQTAERVNLADESVKHAFTNAELSRILDKVRNELSREDIVAVARYRGGIYLWRKKDGR